MVAMGVYSLVSRARIHQQYDRRKLYRRVLEGHQSGRGQLSDHLAFWLWGSSFGSREWRPVARDAHPASNVDVSGPFKFPAIGVSTCQFSIENWFSKHRFFSLFSEWRFDYMTTAFLPKT
jgi:hypothetical protein